MGDDGTVLTRNHGFVAYLALQNPARLNALTPAMLEQIVAALHECRGRRDVRTVVIHGAGDKAFSAGADLSVLGGASPEAFEQFDGLFRAACRAVREFPMPVIAQIQGPCLGGGLSLALEADVRLAARSSRFGIPAARIGIAYPDVWPLIRAVGHTQAALVLFAGDTIDGDEAERIGLVARAIDDSDVAEQAATLAERIAANAPLSVQAAKAALRDAENSGPPSPATVALIEQCRTSRDLAEGLAAFAERRPPIFRGE